MLEEIGECGSQKLRESGDKLWDVDCPRWSLASSTEVGWWHAAGRGQMGAEGVGAVHADSSFRKHCCEQGLEQSVGQGVCVSVCTLTGMCPGGRGTRESRGAVLRMCEGWGPQRRWRDWSLSFVPGRKAAHVVIWVGRFDGEKMGDLWLFL